jgi:hypothetical protein
MDDVVATDDERIRALLAQVVAEAPPPPPAGAIIGVTPAVRVTSIDAPGRRRSPTARAMLAVAASILVVALALAGALVATTLGGSSGGDAASGGGADGTRYVPTAVPDGLRLAVVDHPPAHLPQVAVFQGDGVRVRVVVDPFGQAAVLGANAGTPSMSLDPSPASTAPPTTGPRGTSLPGPTTTLPTTPPSTAPTAHSPTTTSPAHVPPTTTVPAHGSPTTTAPATGLPTTPPSTAPATSPTSTVPATSLPTTPSSTAPVTGPTTTAPSTGPSTSAPPTTTTPPTTVPPPGAGSSQLPARPHLRAATVRGGDGGVEVHDATTTTVWFLHDGVPVAVDVVGLDHTVAVALVDRMTARADGSFDPAPEDHLDLVVRLAAGTTDGQQPVSTRLQYVPATSRDPRLVVSTVEVGTKRTDLLTGAASSFGRLGRWGDRQVLVEDGEDGLGKALSSASFVDDAGQLVTVQAPPQDLRSVVAGLKPLDSGAWHKFEQSHAAAVQAGNHPKHLPGR